VLTLKLAPLHDPASYPGLAAALTRITAETLGKRADLTAVVIEDLPDGAWFIGGQPLDQPSALLEISITAGTNSVAEKAAFIATAQAELARRTGRAGQLATASYVVVRELAGTDWGYDGLTQAARAAARPKTTAADPQTVAARLASAGADPARLAPAAAA